MLLIVCGAHDAEALRVADRLGGETVAIVEPRDLSGRGWRLASDTLGPRVLIAGGKPVAERDISSVLVRRLAVYPQELGHVHPDDRDYVAAELTAILMWWLQQFTGVVLNRPAGGLLCGPYARAEQWLAAAVRAGIDVAPTIRHSHVVTPPPIPAATVTVVGGHALPGVANILCERAACLARAAAAELVEVGFDGDGRVNGAHSFPAMSDAVIDAIASLAEPRAVAPILAEAPA